MTSKIGIIPGWRTKTKGILAALALIAALVALTPSEASAWTCRAEGFGSTGYGRSFSVVRAKLIALRQCQFRSLLHACALIWCRP